MTLNAPLEDAIIVGTDALREFLKRVAAPKRRVASQSKAR